MEKQSENNCPGAGRFFRGMIVDAFVSCPVCKANSEELGLEGMTYRVAARSVIPAHADKRRI